MSIESNSSSRSCVSHKSAESEALNRTQVINECNTDYKDSLKSLQKSIKHILSLALQGTKIIKKIAQKHCSWKYEESLILQESLVIVYRNTECLYAAVGCTLFNTTHKNCQKWSISSIDWQPKYIHRVSQVTTLSRLLCINTWTRSDSWGIALWTGNIWNKKLVKIYHSNLAKATLEIIEKYLYVLGFAWYSCISTTGILGKPEHVLKSITTA